MSAPSRPPAGFVSIVIGLASLAVAIIGLLVTTGKQDRDGARDLERRLCQLEMRQFGKCEK